jgi:uncharacterized paraquat-inducible protein A
MRMMLGYKEQAMKQRVFICQQCGHELTLPRVGMNLREAKSWFKYATCPACKRQLCIVEKVPVPVISTYTQPSLWTATEGGI